MAQVTFADGIESVYGALDSVKEGKKSWTKKDSKKFYHFYNFVYVTILRDMYNQAQAG